MQDSLFLFTRISLGAIFIALLIYLIYSSFIDSFPNFAIAEKNLLKGTLDNLFLSLVPNCFSTLFRLDGRSYLAMISYLVMVRIVTRTMTAHPKAMLVYLIPSSPQQSSQAKGV